MYLHILKYFNDDGSENLMVSKRVEFFAHYWQSIFAKPITSFDPYYLKSHRTIIEKVQLQIRGNFKMSKKRIQFFFVNDPLFSNKDVIVKELVRTKERRAISTLKRLVDVVPGWDESKKAKIETQIKTLDRWLNNSYAKLVSSSLVELLEKNEVLNKIDTQNIKELVNCFIIELYRKGFSTKFIKDLPESLNDPGKFPFKKISSDFQSAEEYEIYKRETFSKLTLKDQVEAIITLLERTEKNRILVFHIFNVNFRIPPVTFFNVTFYNPQKDPKIVHRLPVKLIEETFTLKPVTKYEEGSTCNAYVKVKGLQEEQLFKIGYKKVSAVLNILNKELGVRGKVYPHSVFITNDKFDHIWGSTEAVTRSYKAIDDVKPGQTARLLYLNKIKLTEEEDRKIFNFLSSISDTLSDTEYFNPEKIWMALEALLHLSEDRMKELFFATFKVYLLYNHDIQWRSFLTNVLNSLFVHPELHYHVSPKEAKKLSLDSVLNSYSIIKFRKGLAVLQTRSDVPFLVEIVSKIDEYHSNSATFYTGLESYVDYFITELYSQRNLSLHSNMSDELFLLKQNEIRVMINIFTEVFLHWYLKYPKSKNISLTVERIEKRALRII